MLTNYFGSQLLTCDSCTSCTNQIESIDIYNLLFYVYLIGFVMTGHKWQLFIIDISWHILFPCLTSSSLMEELWLYGESFALWEGYVHRCPEINVPSFGADWLIGLEHKLSHNLPDMISCNTLLFDIAFSCALYVEPLHSKPLAYFALIYIVFFMNVCVNVFIHQFRKSSHNGLCQGSCTCLGL